MTESNEILIQNRLNLLDAELKDLRTEITKIFTELGRLSAGCSVRHRKNLTEELAKVETDLSNVKSDLDKDVCSNSTAIAMIKKELSEAQGAINILRVKLTDLQETSQKSKDNKNNFIMQILIIVLASIITGIIGFVTTQTWSVFKNPPAVQQQTNIEK